ncbi:flagellar assembly protein FliX [Pannonibacter indicus]|uniref:Class II flagellar assembly regulator n=1 Tax=Pannonibacter indicus TaxID=466044 RepID=A0A0K6HLG2_9HYPH|nr:flagellar assembly protein FliX [Pannonibacter indicus]CUA91765.1 Class II flagellar assembly regulator [Pannonibacter indicus]
MRITNNTPVSSVQGKGSKKKAGGGGSFLIGGDGEAHAAVSTSSSSSLSSIDALLSLQEMQVQPDDRDAATARGHSMLDLLDALKADLLAGVIEPIRLEEMMSALADRPVSSDPGLESVIDEIELRVKVELAKQGRFTS